MRLSRDKIEDIYYSEVLSAFVQLQYTYTLDDQLNISLTPRLNFMPTIEVSTMIDEGYYMYTPTLTFPKLSYENDNGGGQTIPWILDKWAEVGRACENLYLFSFNENDYIDE